jgi:hypothetical protein
MWQSPLLTGQRVVSDFVGYGYVPKIWIPYCFHFHFSWPLEIRLDFGCGVRICGTSPFIHLIANMCFNPNDIAASAKRAATCRWRLGMAWPSGSSWVLKGCCLRPVPTHSSSFSRDSGCIPGPLIFVGFLLHCVAATSFACRRSKMAQGQMHKLHA